jgi:hypothetical protein
MVLVSRLAKYDGVAQIAARVTKQPASQFGWVFTKQDYYRDPQMLPNLEALQKTSISPSSSALYTRGSMWRATPT